MRTQTRAAPLKKKKLRYTAFPTAVQCCFRIFAVSMIFGVLKFVQVLGSLLTSLLCIMGELAGGGTVTVAVGVGDRLVTCDTRHVTRVTGRMTCDT